MNLEEYLSEKCSLIEKRLDQLIPQRACAVAPLFDAARYSLLGGGKRLRPILALAAAEMLGGSESIALTPACALEMIHTYSLIHDDLPCMDNDDFRRGKPSLHKAYPEGHAVLTGDYLLTYAFEVLAGDQNLSNEQKVELVLILSQSSGADGMIGGQVMDIAAEGTSLDINHLRQIHEGKTGALIAASLEFGAVVANADKFKREKLRRFGSLIGLAFQVVDDILDVTASMHKRGSAQASDVANNKTTYVSLLGIDKSKIFVKDLTDEALNCLRTLQCDSDRLEQIALSLVQRNH